MEQGKKSGKIYRGTIQETTKRARKSTENAEK